MQTAKFSQFTAELVDRANEIEGQILALELVEISIPADLAIPLMRTLCGFSICPHKRAELRDLVASWVDCFEQCDTLNTQDADLLRRLLQLTGEPVVHANPKPSLQQLLGAKA